MIGCRLVFIGMADLEGAVNQSVQPEGPFASLEKRARTAVQKEERSVTAMSSSQFPQVNWIHPVGGWPSFSPDGTQIVFNINNALWIIDTDGTNLHRLFPAEGSQDSATRADWSWNPDWIAFSLNEEEIWVVHPDGTGAASYYQGDAAPTGVAMYYPSWYQDLSALVAVGYTNQNNPGTEGAELYRMTPETIASLTTSPHPVAGRPSVNPDGTKIAFAGNEGEYKQVENQIWIVAPPGDPSRLEPGNELAFQGRSPNWSPQGDLIVFESTRPTVNPTTKTPLAIYVIQSDGCNPRAITDRTAYSATHAEWNRQQTQIVFQGSGKGIGIINM